MSTAEFRQPEAPSDPPAAAGATHDVHPADRPFPVVGVGASAGGLEAFTEFLAHLPDDTGMAFVLVQHLDPRHESKLVSLLSKATRTPIVEAAQDLAVRPDHIYVIPPNTTMTIASGILQLAPRGEARGLHLPIDQFLKSLAEDQRSAAIGVILSGTGSDGTLALADIKAAGGITFAQDKESAKHDGMPLSAVGSGSVDFILPPKKIALELARMGRHPYLAPPQTAEHGTMNIGEEESFRKIIALLRSSFGVDFTHYRDTTIKRRAMRRMVLHTKETLADYARQLEEDRPELQSLYQDILINVTSFFRDPEMYEALKTGVFPEIIQTKSAGAAVRVWTAGCSTGQEAYSLAIALWEFLDEKPVRLPIQVFATDLSDTVSLEKARAGLYPESIEAEVSPERLRRFFSKEDGKYRINKSIRDLCVFAKQNIVGDPPFSHVDLISCRNVLIYLAPLLQKRVIPTFHYALNPTGFLMLGTSETVGAFSDLFSLVDKKHKIYSKKPSAFRQYPHFNVADYLAGVPGEARTISQPSPTPADLQKEADRIVLGQYAPAGVLVNESLEILQFRGRTSPYLEPAPGAASLNLLKMAREGLFVELKSALAEARKENAAAQRWGVPVQGDGPVRGVNLKVIPVDLPGMGECCFLVLFEEARPPTGEEAAGAGRAAGPRSSEASRARSWLERLSAWTRAAEQPSAGLTPPDDRDRNRELVQLRKELVAAREQQQSTIEQQDATNEELESANEEILSSNEELQSTNEELETAKEELQSVNEELTTVNEQLQNRNVELNRLNDDMVNFLDSGNVPMVALGIDLRIRRFTPAAGKVLNLLPTDVGRSIGDIKPPVEVPDLEALLGKVIETVRVTEREVRDRDGRWYQLRLHPYRTADHKIDGAVMVLFDIDEAKSAQMRLEESADYARAIVQTVREPLLILDGDLRVKSANQSFYQNFQVTPGETENQFLYELGGGQWDIPRLRTLLEDVLPKETSFQDFEVDHTFEVIGRRRMLLNGRKFRGQSGHSGLILLAIDDITERWRVGAELRESRERYRLIVESSTGFAIFTFDMQGVITTWNLGAEKILRFTEAEIIGKNFEVIFTPEDREAGESEMEMRKAAADGQALDERWHVRKGGERFWANGLVMPLKDDAGQTRGYLKILRDMTDQRQLEETLEERTAELQHADRRKNEFLAMLAHELRNPLAAISSAVQLSSRAGTDVDSVAWTNEVIERQVKYLSRLVDDLLDVSRITQGKVNLRKELLELGPVVTRAVAIVRHIIDDRKHELSISLPQEPVCLDADPTRLEQVVVNLLNNAAKYTEPGGRIGIEVERQGDEVVLAVRDTGIGIPPAMLPRVFDIFTQVERSSDRSQGGLGIGLTLVRSLVEMHGGSVSASSTPGEGSVFTVRLPLGEEQPEQSPRADVESRGGDSAARVLIVDDNADLAQSTAELLKLSGHDVQTAYDGPSAIEAARAYRPDVILLDIGLPGMDGFDVAGRVRQEQDLKNTVIIAISGYAEKVDRSRSREAGFDHHLVKPVDFNILLTLLAEITKQQVQ